jgi:hypothetical protein
VTDEALRLLAEQDRLREAHLASLPETLARALKQADRGELLDAPEAVAGMRQSLRRRKKPDKKSG